MKTSTENRWPEARALAERMVADTGASVRAVLMYGSWLLKTNPDRNSAVDFVVIVDDYRAFYTGLSEAGELHRPVGLLTGLARFLAPNVIAYVPDNGDAGLAKCLIVSKDHFERALGPNPPDHFLLGRVVQRLGHVWAAGDADASWVEEQIVGAHGRVLEWMAPYLEGPVDAAGLGRRLLEVCYQGEFRPESRGRAGKVFEAQADHFTIALEPGLRSAVAAGIMELHEAPPASDPEAGGATYALVRPAPPRQVRRWRRHFRRSKTRTTVRWLKHSMTFANWLPYLVRKVERHQGRAIQLTALERKLPAIFLWPRVIHVLVTRPGKELNG